VEQMQHWNQDETRPDQTRPDQARPDQTFCSYSSLGAVGCIHGTQTMHTLPVMGDVDVDGRVILKCILRGNRLWGC